MKKTLLLSTLLGCALALGACTNGAPKPTPAQIVADVNGATQGLLNAVTQVAAAQPTLIPPATLTTIETDLKLAIAAGASLSTNLPAASAATTVQTIDGYINGVLNTLAGPPINGLIPPPYNEMVAAADLIAPELEAFVNEYIPTPATSSIGAPRTSLMKGNSTMSLAKAQGVVADWSKK